MKTSINVKQTGKAVGILAIGLLLGWLLFGGSSSDQPDAHGGKGEAAAKVEGQDEVIYTCSMHPQIRQHEPGNCPICGMELIPVNNLKPDAQDDPYSMTMTPAAIKLAEVQTTRVTKGIAVNKIRMPGKVMVDERNIASITARFPGRIEHLYVDFTGQKVSKGEKLASIYSPQLITAQKELIEARKYKDSNPALYDATRRKLELWDLPSSEIESIEQNMKVKNTVDIVSPLNGYIIQKNVAREDYIDTGGLMYNIADLSTVWVVFDAFESDLKGLNTGDEISFTVDAWPGKTFHAKISFINPVLDAQSRTVSVRAQAQNPTGLLKPQMLAEGVVSSRLYKGKEQILVPKSAVLWTGERSIVYVEKQNTKQPTFEFREVELGPRVGDQYVIKSGLTEGEFVVTHGNFKIDSAAQLAGKASMMNQPASKKNSPDQATKEQLPAQKTNDIPDAFKQELTQAVKEYLELKNALVVSDSARATVAAKDFLNRIAQIDMTLLNHEAHLKWMEKVKEIKEAASKITKSDMLKTQRKAFRILSKSMAGAVKKFGVSDTVYYQYCPMKDAYWLSENKEIKNPYFGKMMLSCGNTVETID